MITQTIEMTQLESSDCYQLIKDEQLASIIISSQILAGSRILLSTYQQVVFSDCTFYACDFKGVLFENCVFENCNFEFSHLRHCKFRNCSFVNCKWKASSSTNSTYENCFLSKDMEEKLEDSSNRIIEVKNRDYTTDIYIELALAS